MEAGGSRGLKGAWTLNVKVTVHLLARIYQVEQFIEISPNL
jgi:hypothetical protein